MNIKKNTKCRSRIVCHSMCTVRMPPHTSQPILNDILSGILPFRNWHFRRKPISSRLLRRSYFGSVQVKFFQMPNGNSYELRAGAGTAHFSQNKSIIIYYLALQMHVRQHNQRMPRAPHTTHTHTAAVAATIDNTKLKWTKPHAIQFIVSSVFVLMAN